MNKKRIWSSFALLLFPLSIGCGDDDRGAGGDDVDGGASLDDGRSIDHDLFKALLAEELQAIRAAFNPARLDEAAALFEELVESEDCAEFLTLGAYARL